MEEKKYNFIGKVEIGTDERNRADKAEARVKELTEQLDKANGFINSTEEIKTKYKLYLIEQQVNKTEDL